MSDEPPLHGSAIMEETIALHPQLQVISCNVDHAAMATAMLAASMQALRPAGALSITFTGQGADYWTCHIWDGTTSPGLSGSAYGTGKTALAAYREAMAVWSDTNPEAPAG